MEDDVIQKHIDAIFEAASAIAIDPSVREGGDPTMWMFAHVARGMSLFMDRRLRDHAGSDGQDWGQRLIEGRVRDALDCVRDA